MVTLGGGLLQQPAEPDQYTATLAWGQYRLIWGAHATPSNTQRTHRTPVYDTLEHLYGSAIR